MGRRTSVFLPFPIYNWIKDNLGKFSMCRSPGTAAPIPQVVAQAECIDFLLHFFQGQLMVIPHADIILHLFILSSWDIHRAVIMVGKAFCNVTRIPLIRFDFFLSLNYRHGGWCQDNTCDIMLCQLVVQGIAQASCLITAYKRYICNGLLSFVFRPGRADKKIVSQEGERSNVPTGKGG